MNAVDILCRVVDNYGDIGVVWRLAKALVALRPGIRVRIVTDHLEQFHQLWPAVDPDLPVQTKGNFTIIDWDHPWNGFRQAPPSRVIEAFACGRPAFYEAVLHDPDRQSTCLHIILEYLSAEPWTAEIHLLPSLSPVPQVKKVYFMPGFIVGTGGLILDRGFIASRDRARAGAGEPAGRVARLRDLGINLPMDAVTMTWCCLFSYEHDYSRMLVEMAAWQVASGQKLLVLVAAGRSAQSFQTAWESAGQPVAACFLPFLPQEAWDEVLIAADLAIVRGEESLARASLAGHPFVWHAYLQEEGYQRVKVGALLEVMAPCFAGPGIPEAEVRAFAAYRDLVLAFNERSVDSHELPATESWAVFLDSYRILEPGFCRFTKMLENLGDTAANLLSLMDDFG